MTAQATLNLGENMDLLDAVPARERVDRTGTNCPTR